MTPRSLAILAAVTVLVTIAAALAWIGGHHAGAASARGEVMFPALTARDTALSRLEIKSAAYTLDLEAKNGNWVAASHGNYPVAADAVNRLIAEVAALRRWEPKTSRPDWYPRIGVEDVAGGSQSTEIRFVGQGGTALTDVLVGKRSSSIGANPAGGTFVRAAGETEAWLTAGTVTLPASVGEWIAPVLHVPGPDVRRISIREGNQVVFEAMKPDGQTTYQLVSLVSPSATERVLANDNAVKAISQGIVSVSVLDVRALADIAFPDTARTVTFTTQSGLQIAARLGAADGKTWVAFSATAPAGSEAATEAAAINARTAAWAFLLDSAKLGALQVPVATLFTQVAAPPAQTQGNTPAVGPRIPQ